MILHHSLSRDDRIFTRTYDRDSQSRLARNARWKGKTGLPQSKCCGRGISGISTLANQGKMIWIL